MNILLINHYAGSPEMGMEYRPYYLAKEWKKNGHNVSVIASSFSHVRSVQPEIKENSEVRNIEGISYVWIKTKEYKGNTIKRFYNILEFVFKLFIKSKYIATTFKPDVVIASSTYPLDIYPASRIAKKANAKLIYEIHDLWPLSPMEIGGYSKYHPFIMLMQAAENYCYKKSDLVVSILPKTLEHCLKHGLMPLKWHFIPNGINVQKLADVEELPQKQENLIKEIRSKYKSLVGYMGSIGLANALDAFVLSAKKISDDKIAFVIIGKGPEKDSLIRLKNENGIINVFFIETVPKKTVIKMLGYFDILYIGLKKQKLFRFGISPNKLFDYMYSGKPIIQAIEAGNDMVSEAGCGITVEPENPDAIAEAIIKLIAKPEEELALMGRKGKEFVIKNHDYKIISENFLNLMSEVQKHSH